MGPIFNIFFINKVAVGPINSTATVPLQCYLSPPFCKTREMKKKKKMKKRRRQTQVSAESKRHLSDCLDKAEKASESASSIFLFFMHVFLGRRQDYCSRAHKVTYYVLFTHCSHIIHGTHNHFIQRKILKMYSTMLFIHLKIILLQNFQFSTNKPYPKKF